MPNEYVQKSWSGGAPARTLSGAITNVATSFTINDGTAWPTSNFVAVIDRGLATEEKLFVVSRVGTTLSSVQRGYDGTSAQAHSGGATIEHCLDAYTIEQANALANAMTTQYDLAYRGAAGNAFNRVSIGATAQLLAVTAGGPPGWETLGLNHIPNALITGAKIATDTITATNIAANAVGNSELADNSVTSAKIVDGTIATGDLADGSITLAKLAAAVQALLVPAGVVCEFLGTSAPTGWVLHNQTLVNAQSVYPSLWANTPTSWRSGANLIIPDLSDLVMMQTGGSVSAHGTIGSAMTVTLATANLPSHTHSIDHDHGAVTSSTNSVDHTHTYSATTSTDGNHQHAQYVVANGIGAVSTRADWTVDTVTGGILPQTGVSTDPAGNHTHSVSGTTAGQSATHTHSVDLPNFTGTSGAAGSGTAVTIRPRHLGVTYIIKAH